MIKVFHVGTIKDFFGVYDITIIINNKKMYTYSMKSEYDVAQFLQILKYHPGKALNYLKKYCIKEKEIENGSKEVK